MTKAKKTSKPDVYQQVTDQIISLLEQGTAPWQPCWDRTGGQYAQSLVPLRHTGAPYQGVNVILLWAAQQAGGYSANQWMTYKQAAAIGANVRKGERGTRIVYFKPLEVKDKATGEKSTIPLLRSYTVFNLEQIDNLPDKYLAKPAEPEKRTDGDPHNACDANLYATGASIHHDGDRAYYRPATDSVHMPAFDAFHSADAYTSVLAHELVHWTGADNRLARDLRNSHGTADHAREELVAELGAAFVCASYGVAAERRTDHAAYLANWLEVLREDKRAIFKAASAAQKAATYIIEAGKGEMQCAA